jgi:hypothetical protein
MNPRKWIKIRVGDLNFPLRTELPLTFPCAVRVQFWNTPSQTMDSIDKKSELTRQNGRKTTPNTQ